MGKDVTHWTSVARQWIDWASTPDHDAFWAYRKPFEAFVGPGAGSGLEIGCGEGRVSRVLGALGYEMTVCDPVPAMIEAARNAQSATTYLIGPGHAVPSDARFDLVVLYNVLMDVDDLDGTLTEAMRLLAPQGRLIIGVVHPLADLFMALRQAEAWDGLGSYFETRYFEDIPVDRSGLSMHFRGWARPLSTYTDAISQAGADILRLSEPEPDPDHPWSADSRWSRLPLFLWIEARHAR